MYIGKQPQIGNYQTCDSITATATDTFNLTVGNVAVSPISAHHCLVSLNGILQAPITSYTIVGSTIVFASALTTSDSIDFITILGNTLDTGTPSDGTISNAKLGTNVISGETDIGGALADADLILVDDGAGGTLRKSAMSRVKTYVGGGISVADQWRLTTTFTGDANPIASNWEQVDYTAGLQGTLGSAMTQSSGIFTFPSTGIYLVTFFANFALNENDRSISAYIEATTDNSTYQSTAVNTAFIQQTDSNWTGSMASTLALVDVIDTANDKVAFRIDGQDSNTQVQGNSNETTTGATFIRLGDT